MTIPARSPAVSIRAAVRADARGIAVLFLESAEHHARLDPVRYHVPAIEGIVARYGEERQQPPDPSGITLVAECSCEIVGFVDARCEPSPDPMHRNVIFCHVTEIVVSDRYRSGGIGTQLLRAAEDWGRREGAAFALLEYHVANKRAAEFYQRKLGYTVAAITATKAL